MKLSGLLAVVFFSLVVVLPAALPEPATEVTQVEIKITQTEYFINDIKVSKGNLLAVLKTFVHRDATQVLSFKVHKDVPYTTIEEVLKICAEAGFTELRAGDAAAK